MLPANLRLLPSSWAGALVAILLSILGVSAFILLLDSLFPLQASYASFFTAPLWPRMGWMMAAAAIEEVKYRLLLMTGLAWLFSRWRYGIFAAIILAQLVNVWPFVLADPPYGSLRYWLVGCVWGWLYWRHGWVSALIGHAACHLALDPLLLLAL